MAQDYHKTTQTFNHHSGINGFGVRPLQGRITSDITQWNQQLLVLEAMSFCCFLFPRSSTQIATSYIKYMVSIRSYNFTGVLELISEFGCM